MCIFYCKQIWKNKTETLLRVLPAASIHEGLTNPLKRKQARRFISAGLVRFTLVSRSFLRGRDIHVSLTWGRGVRHGLVKTPAIALGLSQFGDFVQRASCSKTKLTEKIAEVTDK
jgi:hypothetical protein